MPKHNNPYFAPNLEFYLAERNMTQQELAAKIYKDSSMISNYKKDRRNLDDDTLLDIAKVLGVSVEDLLKPRTVIDNKISGVKKSLENEELTDEERLDYANKTFDAIPQDESEIIVDKKNADEKLGKLIIKHPLGKILVYGAFIICAALLFHPHPLVKLIAQIILIVAGLIIGCNIKNTKKIDKVLNVALYILLAILGIVLLILIIKNI